MSTFIAICFGEAMVFLHRRARVVMLILSLAAGSALTLSVLAAVRRIVLG